MYIGAVSPDLPEGMLRLRIAKGDAPRTAPVGNGREIQRGLVSG